MRFQSLEDDVRRDLKDHIRYEEDHERSLVLVTNELKVFCKTENGGIGDIGSVEKREEIEHRKDGYNAKVDLGQQTALGHARGRDHRDIVVLVVGGRMGNVRVVVGLTRSKTIGVGLYVPLLVA